MNPAAGPVAEPTPLPSQRGPRLGATRSLSVGTVAAVAFAFAAPAFPAVQVTLLGHTKLPNSVFVTELTGYVDTLTLREYAIVGDDYQKVYIVDATDPADMRIVSQIAAPGFDVAVWDHYLYVCDGNFSGLDSRVIDLTDPANPVVAPNGFFSAHTIAASPSGLLFLEFPGLRILDVAANPLAPALRYQTGGQGHDATPKGNRLYDFHGGAQGRGTVIWDITDPASPDTLGVVNDPSIIFHHSGDVTADHRYLYICDELALHPTADVTIWDIADPATPIKMGSLADPDATIHHFFVVGDLAFTAYYSAGFKVFDVSNPINPVLAARYDTSKRAGEGIIGAIGVYSSAPSGNVYVSDIENGLFVFSVTTTTSQPSAQEGFVLGQNSPNPFNPTTRIPIDLTRPGRAVLVVYDVAGRPVRRLLDRFLGAGPHEFAWDGRDDAGRRVASGVYFYRLDAAGRSETRRMVLLK